MGTAKTVKNEIMPLTARWANC